MNIVLLQDDDKEWSEFLNRNNHLIFHTPQYKRFIDSAFRSKILYFAAVENRKVRTILPVFHINHPFFGSKLISTAFLEYGGPCGDETFIPDIIDFIAKDFSKKCKYLEIRYGLDGYEKLLSGLMRKRIEYKRFVLTLEDEQVTWQKIQREKRKSIRNAGKLGVVTREVNLEELSEVYDLYCRNMRAFGSPPFPISYFESFFSNLVDKNMGKIFGSYHKDKMISLLLGFLYRERIHIVISVSDFKYLKYRPNDAMHWSFIKFGCDNGYKFFDFGRVREDSGHFVYKKKWGASLYDLSHFYLLWRIKKIPYIDPENPKYRIFADLWRRLPLFITRRTGPWLREGLGI